jgi:tRNA modification GTPase
MIKYNHKMSNTLPATDSRKAWIAFIIEQCYLCGNIIINSQVYNYDTICALSTPTGVGAIAVIRISGDKAVLCCSSLISFSDRNKKLQELKANTVHFGEFVVNSSTIDNVVITVFKAPHSYTGEDVIEISCHGSQYIQQKILETLIKSGIRLAKPGEFTQRAFLNGKMDLSQAEGVADLIASGSEAAHRFALNQMRGEFSKEINKLRDELLHFISLIELELDFSEEDVEFADRKKLSELVERLSKAITKLIQSFEFGNAVKNGIPVAIIGRTNSGKSTLLNQLLHEERAIVSEIAGTTRDFIEDTIILQGIQFRFIDTAGLRHSTDAIENEGIQRTILKFNQAIVVIIVSDIKDDLSDVIKTLSFLRKENDELSKKVLIFALNKIDTFPKQELEKIHSAYIDAWGDIAQVLPISAKLGTGLAQLEKLLVTKLTLKPTESEVVITNVRHFEALNHASEALSRVRDGIHTSLSSDLLAQDIRETMHYLGEITGEITNDEILGNIFKNFCIGK